MKNVTQVVPSKMQKQIKVNKSMYGRRIEQLAIIIEDNSYIPKGSENTYHEFIFSMWQALVTGRRITPKMESAITKIVKIYAKHLKKESDPEYKKKKDKYIEGSLSKISLIRILLKDAKYSEYYEHVSKDFLNSISEQIKNRGSLSVKQRQALNKMYKQFTKRIEKNNGV